MEYSTLIGYLEDPSFFKTTVKESVLEYATKNDMTKAGRDLYMRLFSDNAQGSGPMGHSANDADNDGPTPPKRSFSGEWHHRKQKKKENAKRIQPDPGSLSGAALLQEIKKDMGVYEKSGERCGTLEKVTVLM